MQNETNVHFSRLMKLRLIMVFSIVIVSLSQMSAKSVFAEPLCDPHPNFSASENVRFFPEIKLENCGENQWYRFNDSETVFIFIHGINSDSRSAFFQSDEEVNGNISYWPELVRTDRNFSDPSIFLADFSTPTIGGGIYDLRAAANSLFDRLTTPSPENNYSVIDKRNIVFVAHSAGGIVVRHMLSRIWQLDKFEDKAIGLVLVASPSLGSKDATRLSGAFRIAKNKIGEQLEWYSSFLVELDKDFRSILKNGTLPYLGGVELIENHFIIEELGYLGKEPVVEEESAARYFGEGKIIEGSHHSSIAKPTDYDDESHVKLTSYFLGSFKSQVSEANAAGAGDPKVVLMDTFSRIYEPRPDPGEMNAHVIQRKIRNITKNIDIEPVHTNWNDDERIAKLNADLIVIHYSSFARQKRDRSAINIWGKDRLSILINEVLEKTTNTKFLVYSRRNSEAGAERLEQSVRRMVPDRYKNRVSTLPIFNGTFNHHETEEALWRSVKSALNQ